MQIPSHKSKRLYAIIVAAILALSVYLGWSLLVSWKFWIVDKATNEKIRPLPKPEPQRYARIKENSEIAQTEFTEQALTQLEKEQISKRDRERMLAQVLDMLAAELSEKIAELQKEVAESERPIEDIAPRMARRGVGQNDYKLASAADVLVLMQNVVTEDRKRLGIIARLAYNLAPMNTSSISFSSQNGKARLDSQWHSLDAPTEGKQKLSLLLHLLVARQLDHKDLASNALESSAWLKASLGDLRAAAGLFEERGSFTENLAQRKKSIRRAADLYQKAGDLEASRKVLQRVLAAEGPMSPIEKAAEEAKIARIAFRESVRSQNSTAAIVTLIDQCESSHGISPDVAFNIASDVVNERSNPDQLIEVNLWVLVESSLHPVAKAVAAESVVRALKQLDSKSPTEELPSAIAAINSIAPELQDTQWHVPTGLVLADLYDRVGDFEEADLVRRQHLEQLTPTDPAIISIQEARVRSLIAQNRMKDAAMVLQELSSAWPGYEPQGDLRDFEEGKIE